VTSLSVLARGSLDDKLRWTFSLYDVDGDGVISRAEMTSVVTSIYGLMGKYTSPAISSSTIRQHVDRIFQVAPTNLNYFSKFLGNFCSLSAIGWT